jgi:oxygen-independent coproporphyrinogen-3 oxidase
MVQSRQVTPLPAEQDAQCYELTMDYLTARGYEQYEVSNFAKPGYRSRHNGNYWNHSNYLGFGPSAHSFWSSEGRGENRRWWNVSNVIEYAHRLEQKHIPLQGEEQLSLQQLMDEEIFLGLRSDGIDVAGFRKKYGRDFFEMNRKKLNDLLDADLARFHDNRLRLTPRGYLVCDEICSSFLA